MKKNRILISGVILILSILILCITIKEKYKISECKIDSSSFVYEYTEKDMKDKLKIDVNMLNEFKVLSSLSNLESERIMVFSVKEKKMEKIKGKVAKYLDELKIKFKDSKQLDIIKQVKTYQKDDLYFVVISNNGNTIMKDLKERLA